MNLASLSRAAGWAAVFTISLAVAHAQVTAPVPSGSVAGSGAGVIGGIFTTSRISPAIARMPYSATRKTTRVQILANGTTITHETVVKEARDSEGRTYRASEIQVSGNADHQPLILYNVFDPVNRIAMNWASNGKFVTVSHFPEPQARAQLPQAAPPVALPDRPAIAPAPLPRASNSNVKFEDLGTQTINGVLARGQRTTRIIPEGAEGNDQPIAVTTETWNSRELRMIVLSIMDDPRSGNTRMEMTDIDRNEPDPALFQAPQGYEVREITPGQPMVSTSSSQ